jgi:putative addiction module killer protein
MELIHTIIYTTSTGKEPFNDWIDKLERYTRSIIDTRLKRMRLGNFGDCKLLKGTSGIWELRIDCGPGYRVYFGKDGHTIVVLLLGGSKKSQEQDIEKAQTYWLDHKKGYHGKQKKSL